MLETKGLYKIYKPKRGVPVTALKNVNVRFPDTGMVFLLGKSGSGKSTLLNVLGGLDRYDKGEIVIKGVSSQKFRQKHFDSYRNTYVGFIFQEYNVLEEFTVGANIALALQLQGKKATNEAINAILREVDLEGYGNRRPNELSGGQKQRVAIARALVKRPEIIMADEPTGALDSATGRQVLETLKRLSADRLVIVVSHDREFAERYADRIIELADGSIIRDVERSAEALPETPLTFNEDELSVQAGYQLTEEDRLAINEWLAQRENGATVHRTAGNALFRPTDTAKIPHRDGANFKLIKSRLPLRNAFRIGGSSLKHKKIRLIVTILLSCIAFGLFGLADTFGAYNHVETCTRSMIDSDIGYVSVHKQKKIVYSDNDFYWREIRDSGLTEQDLEAFEEETGVALKGINDFGRALTVEHQTDGVDTSFYSVGFNGFAAVTEQDLAEMGFTLQAGRLPEGNAKEIAVSSYFAEAFVAGKYRKSIEDEFQILTSSAALVGKTLNPGGEDYTVVGIVDTKLDMERYKVLLEDAEHLTTAEELVRYAMMRELNYAANYSLATTAMVSTETFAALRAAEPALKECTFGGVYFYGEDGIGFDPWRVGKLADQEPDTILWVDGPRTTLKENEIIVSADLIGFTDWEQDRDAMIETAKAYNGMTRSCWIEGSTDANHNVENVTVVGVLKPEGRDGSVVLDDAVYAALTAGGDYDLAVGGMPGTKEEVRNMTAYCYSGEDTRLALLNSVTYELDTVHDILKQLAKIFLYIGLGFALFAALMLANFIATSISYKKQEIGILRAIGSRSSDVFRIFFSESFIIAMINFVLSAAGVGIATAVVNWALRKNGILISVLTFGPRQILLLLGASLAVAALASFFPVQRIARKRPIDAIRNR